MRQPTEAEILQETIDAAREGRLPDLSRFQRGEPAPPQTSTDDTDGDIFSLDDLADVQGREYPIPGTAKRVYVFPLSEDDFELLLQWSLAIPVQQPAEEMKAPEALRHRQAQGKIFEAQMHVFQMILACRRGPSKNTSERCFRLQDAPKLRKQLARTTVEEICALSDSLGRGEEQIGPGVRRFFTVFLSACEIWLGTSSTSTDCPRGLMDTLRELQSRASASLSHGRWVSGTGFE